MTRWPKLSLAVVALVALALFYVARDEFSWRTAVAQDLIAEYQRYILLHPSGRHLTHATDRIHALQNDDVSWQGVQAGSRQALQGFLTRFPGHRRELEARRLSSLKSIALTVAYDCPACAKHYGCELKLPFETFAATILRHAGAEVVPSNTPGSRVLKIAANGLVGGNQFGPGGHATSFEATFATLSGNVDLETLGSKTISRTFGGNAPSSRPLGPSAYCSRRIARTLVFRIWSL